MTNSDRIDLLKSNQGYGNLFVFMLQRIVKDPALNMQQATLGTSHLTVGDSLVKVVQNMGTSYVTTIMLIFDDLHDTREPDHSYCSRSRIE